MQHMVASVFGLFLRAAHKATDNIVLGVNIQVRVCTISIRVCTFTVCHDNDRAIEAV